MSISMYFEIVKASSITGLDEERIGPLNLTVAKGDAFVRKRVALTATKWTTLDAGEIGTAWHWTLFNVGDNDISIGFGAGAMMTLETTGIPCTWTGSVVPYAKGVSAASEILYIAMANT